jgi:hypothetical protein
LHPADLWSIAALASASLLISYRLLRKKESSPEVTEGSRPADGVAEWIEPVGLERLANPERDGVGRLIAPRREAFGKVRSISANAGTPRLLGEVAVWSIFVGRDGRDWTDDEIAQALVATERACIWLEEEALRLGAPLNLSLVSTYLAGRDDREEEAEIGFVTVGDRLQPGTSEVEAKGIGSTSRVARDLGFSDVVDLVECLSTTVKADHQAWVVHLRREGTSFAVPPDLTPIPGLCMAFCYVDEATFSGPLRRFSGADPVTIAHELLHLFGASDKYNTSIRSYPEGSVTRRDIMRLNYDRLSQLRVDRLTASELGWDREIA